MKLSVLVTFCRQKDFIKNALESILAQQTDFEYEVITGLDGNDIESENIINEYIKKNTNISLYKIDNSNEKTINIIKASKNRINLLKHARGEYFCLLDGDDFYSENNRFQKLIDFLDNNQQYIGAAHDFVLYNNETKQKDYSKPLLNEEEISFSPIDYIKQNKHIWVNCFIFRNIFLGKIPNNLNNYFFNDSTITHYMLKYGNIYYFPKIMMCYRVNTDSVYNSLKPELQNIYALLCSEINQQTIPCLKKEIAISKEMLFKYCLKNCTKLKENEEIKLIKQTAKEHNCNITYNILNYKNLSILNKIKLKLLKFEELKKNTGKEKITKLHYFLTPPNFGDILNLYILQHIFCLNIKFENINSADLIAIGSLFECLFGEEKSENTKPVKVFGTGFIMENSGNNTKLKRKLNIVGVRGLNTKKRMEKILNTKLDNIFTGDPALLASELIDTQNTKKYYKTGIILHYIDENDKAIENIKLSDYKLINVGKNPIQILKEISECETIFSSAMHGLIAADSLNIPNKRIILSGKLTGKDYKFYDYYSVFDRKPPKTIDLRHQTLTNKDIDILINEYKIFNPCDKIKQIQKDLLAKGNLYL